MTRHILLIDDDQDDAELFSDALNELDMDSALAHFSDGISALEKLREKKSTPPDIIFLDINMPRINGWECLREIKDIAHLDRIPIVMYSTSNISLEGVDAHDVGAAAFLTKPSNFEELKTKLSSLLDQFVRV